MRSVGFDLDNSFFYVHGSNIDDVAKFGTNTNDASITLYTNNNSNTHGFKLGVFGATPAPTFWIGSNAPQLSINGNNVGIGTSQPAYTLDIHGDMRVTGRSYQTEAISSLVVQSTTHASDFISSLNNGTINFTNTPLSNINSLDVNGQTTTSKLLVQDVSLQRMGNMQCLRAMRALPTPVVSNNLLDIAVTLAWSETPVEPVFTVELAFFGSGTSGTRMHLNTTYFINAISATTDSIIHKSIMRSDDVVECFPYVEKVGIRAVRIGVKWQLLSAVSHYANLKLDAIGPSSLGTLTCS
jgi:hypothetical protein